MVFLGNLCGTEELGFDSWKIQWNWGRIGQEIRVWGIRFRLHMTSTNSGYLQTLVLIGLTNLDSS